MSKMNYFKNRRSPCLTQSEIKKLSLFLSLILIKRSVSTFEDCTLNISCFVNFESSPATSNIIILIQIKNIISHRTETNSTAIHHKKWFSNHVKKELINPNFYYCI